MNDTRADYASWNARGRTGARPTDPGAAMALAVVFRSPTGLRNVLLANVGDCRAIVFQLMRNGKWKVQSTTLDHDMGAKEEVIRIANAGSAVIGVGATIFCIAQT